MRRVPLVRIVLVAFLAVSCTPARAVDPSPTENPRIAVLEAQVFDLTAERDHAYVVARDARDSARHEPFSMWSVPRMLYHNMSRVGGLPDTFTSRIAFTATTPVKVEIMGLEQYVLYKTGRQYTATSYPAATKFDLIFHDAEGCASYVIVLTAKSDALVIPDFTVTYAPAKHPTGECAAK